MTTAGFGPVLEWPHCSSQEQTHLGHLHTGHGLVLPTEAHLRPRSAPTGLGGSVLVPVCCERSLSRQKWDSSISHPSYLSA